MDRDHKIRLAVAHLSGEARAKAIASIVRDPVLLPLYIKARMARLRAQRIKS